MTKLFSLFLFFYSFTLIAQPDKVESVFPYQNLRFDNLTLKDGLSSKDITFVHQDHRGHIWIGTKDGLNRYDGINIKIYRRSEKGNSLPDNRLNSIVEDTDGTLWIGTQGGISHFNPFSEVFENFVHDPKNPKSLSDNWDCNIFKDSKNRLWVMNNDGLHLLDRTVKSFTTRFNKINHPFYCFQDETGNFWLATWSGIVRFNSDNDTFRYLEKTNCVANCVLKDSQKNWWLGAWDIGLCRLDIQTGTYKKIPLDTKNRDAKYNVFGLKEINQQIWVSTNLGLFIIPVKELNQLEALAKARHYEHESNNPFSLAGINSTGIFQDKQGTIWVYTDGGVSRVFPSKQLFGKLSIPNKALISEFFFDEKINIIGGWGMNALTITDKKFNILQTYQNFPPQLNTQGNHAINAIIKDKDKYWIGTMNGLVLCDFNKKQFKVYQHDEKNPNSLAHRRINALLKDSKGRLWVGLYDWGLDLLEPKTESFIHFTYDAKKANTLGDNLIWELIEDKKGNIWILQNRCLSRFEEKTRTFTNFRHEVNNLKSLSGDRMISIFLDKKGQLWVGTDNGLNLFDDKTQSFSHWTTDEGLPNNECTNIQEDNEGNIWVGTANGLSKFDTQKQQFFNFTELDGLAGNVISGDFEKDKDGNLYIGHYERIDKINPASVKTNDIAPKVLLTNLKILNQEKHFDIPLEQIGELQLPYYENEFSCNFIAINYNNPSKNQYAYRLEGLEKNWKYVGNQQLAAYSNLREGEYTFHVKAANNDGIWNEDGVKLKIIISPPFWRTWWFSALMAIIVTGIGYAFFVFRIRQVRKEEAQKSAISEQIAELRMRALRVQMNPHFMFNSLNAIQECVITGQTDAAVTYLAQFSKLMRMVLENSDKRRIPLDKELETIRLYLDLEKLRFSEVFHTEIKVQTHEESSLLTIPPMMIQPFLENAIWHGLLKKKGKKILKINISSDETFLYIHIEDNGIGRDAAENRKNQIKPEHTSKALSILDERMKIITELNQIKADFTIVDLYDSGQKPLGTRVEIKIPI
ncbi:MAG TPA: two-component regulator propeller domain-containing protein [Emticicia sp.]